MTKLIYFYLYEKKSLCHDVFVMSISSIIGEKYVVKPSGDFNEAEKFCEGLTFFLSYNLNDNKFMAHIHIDGNLGK